MRASLASILFVIVLTSGCDRSSASPDELQRYILNEKNGLFKTVVCEGITASLFYRPIDLLAFQEMSATDNKLTLNQIRLKYKDHAYFILRLSKNTEEFLNQFAREQKKYADAVHYFSEDINNDLMLISEHSKRKPETITLLQSFGISTHTDIMVVFRSEGLHEKENFKITLTSSEFIPGFYEFNFEAKEIRCVPILNPLSYESI